MGPTTCIKTIATTLGSLPRNSTTSSVWWQWRQLPATSEGSPSFFFPQEFMCKPVGHVFRAKKAVRNLVDGLLAAGWGLASLSGCWSQSHGVEQRLLNKCSNSGSEACFGHHCHEFPLFMLLLLLLPFFPPRVPLPW